MPTDADSVLRLFEAVYTAFRVYLVIYKLTDALQKYPEVASVIFWGSHRAAERVVKIAISKWNIR
jgi:acyl-CoA reductase-like NAD-dependent aldehyde dehydrogenase